MKEIDELRREIEALQVRVRDLGARVDLLEGEMDEVKVK